MAAVTSVEVTRTQLGPGIWLICVEGQVDLYSAPELKMSVSEAINDGADQLVFDMRETTFMDSTGLGVLVGAMKRLRPLDGSIAIVCPDSNLRRLFEISGLEHLFDFRDELPEAARR